jgi:hypothetical protein
MWYVGESSFEGLKGKRTISIFPTNISVWEHTCCFVGVTIADVVVTEIILLWSQTGTLLYCTVLHCTIVWLLHNILLPALIRVFFCNPILFAIYTSTLSKLGRRCIQWHVEECSVALLCNWWVQSLLWLLGNETYKLNLKNKITNTTITLGIWLADHLTGVFAIACCLVTPWALLLGHLDVRWGEHCIESYSEGFLL